MASKSSTGQSVHKKQSAVMRKNAEKPWFQRILWKKMIMSFIVVYVFINLVGGCFSIVELKRQEKQVTAQMEQAKIEEAQLQAQIEYMRSDVAVEKLAREKLGLVKPKEILVVRADDVAEANQ